jgi:hypothetical protein
MYQVNPEKKRKEKERKGGGKKDWNEMPAACLPGCH